MARLGITGSLRATPTVRLERILALQSLDFLIKKRTWLTESKISMLQPFLPQKYVSKAWRWKEHSVAGLRCLDYVPIKINSNDVTSTQVSSTRNTFAIFYFLNWSRILGKVNLWVNFFQTCAQRVDCWVQNEVIGPDTLHRIVTVGFKTDDGATLGLFIPDPYCTAIRVCVWRITSHSSELRFLHFLKQQV